jgi:hypothetical protein
VQQPGRDGAEEVGADDQPARPQDPCSLRQGTLPVNDMVQHQDRQDRIKGAVREWQGGRIRLPHGRPLASPG